MKIKLFSILLALLVFTGCGKNQLMCEKKSKNAGYDYSETYKLIYNDNKDELIQIELTMKSKYNEFYTEEEIKEEYDDVLEYCDFYESGSHKLIECQPELKKSEIDVNIKIKVEKISDELFENMMYVTKDEINELKTAKKLLENVGYTCKNN